MTKTLHHKKLSELKSEHTSLKEQITNLCKDSVVDSDLFRALMQQRAEIQNSINSLSMEMTPDIIA